MNPLVLTLYLLALVASLAIAILTGPSGLSLILFLTLCVAGIYTAVDNDKDRA